MSETEIVDGAIKAVADAITAQDCNTAANAGAYEVAELVEKAIRITARYATAELGAELGAEMVRRAIRDRDEWNRRMDQQAEAHESAVRDATVSELVRLTNLVARGRTITVNDLQNRIAEIHGDAEWCNCQAIPGTSNYPGPWHERGGESHYPCAQKGK